MAMDNSEVDFASTIEGSVAMYICTTGYLMEEGGTTMNYTCTSDGSWQSNNEPLPDHLCTGMYKEVV